MDQEENGEMRPFLPYDIVDGKKYAAPLRSYVLAKQKTIRKADGVFATAFHEEGLHPSLPAVRPFRSRAVVFENGKPLDWIVSDEMMISERTGSFAHFGRQIVFSATDGSDPRENGKEYVVGFYPTSLQKMLPF